MATTMGSTTEGEPPRPCRVQPRVSPLEVVDRLAPAVHWPGALETQGRTWRLMARTPEFDAWLIAWPSGGNVEFHDHGNSTGAVKRHQRDPSSSRSRGATTPGVSPSCASSLHAGAAWVSGPGTSTTSSTNRTVHALSLHVYSPALTAMTFYDVVGRPHWWSAGSRVGRRRLRRVRARPPGFGIAEVEAASPWVEAASR